MPHHDAPERSPLATRDHLLRAARQRYRAATKREKGQILNEFVARTGYHRKHAVRLLRCRTAVPRRRIYDQRVRDALFTAWEAAGRPGSRRLKKLLPELVTILEEQGNLPRDLVLRGQLLMASAATIDRLLASVRANTTAAVLEQRLENISKMLTELADLTIPADLAPAERERLTAGLAKIAILRRAVLGRHR